MVLGTSKFFLCDSFLSYLAELWKFYVFISRFQPWFYFWISAEISKRKFLNNQGSLLFTFPPRRTLYKWNCHIQNKHRISPMLHSVLFFSFSVLVNFAVFLVFFLPEENNPVALHTQPLWKCLWPHKKLQLDLTGRVKWDVAWSTQLSKRLQQARAGNSSSKDEELILKSS